MIDYLLLATAFMLGLSLYVGRTIEKTLKRWPVLLWTVAATALGMFAFLNFQYYVNLLVPFLLAIGVISHGYKLDRALNNVRMSRV